MGRPLTSGLFWLPALLLPLLLVYFARTDFYHAGFEQAGWRVALYQGARLGFAVCFAWLLAGSGTLLLRFWLGGTWHEPLEPGERAICAMLAGSGGGLVLGFLLGLLHLYKPFIGVGIAVAVWWASLPMLEAALRHGGRAWRTRTRTQTFFGLALLIAAAWLASVKGLYPAGGHDYFTHYFPYYNAVLRDSGLVPNEVWYHFFYSKGAGLFFWAMLMSDPLAPSLVSLVMVCFSAALLAALVHRMRRQPALAALTALVFLLLMIYTPGPEIFRAQGGWGDFEKLHESAAALSLGLLWLWSWKPDAHAAAALRSALLVLVAAALTVLESAAGALFALMAAIAWLISWRMTHGLETRHAALRLLLGTGGALLALMAINYGSTGIPLDQGLSLWWPLLDWDTIGQWGVGLELHFLHWLHGFLKAQRSLEADLLPLACYYLLRLDLLWPLCLLGAVAYIAARPGEKTVPAETKLLAGFLLALLALLLAAGSSQFVSYYRFGTLATAPVLVLAAWLWGGAVTAVPRRVRPYALAAMLASSLALLPLWQEGGRAVTQQAAALVHGEYSLADAYRHQEGWPGRASWGGIHPGAEAAWRIAGPNTRIWSFNRTSYCMLPGCRVETFMSFRFSPHWRQVMFASPQQARRVLQNEGLNYFLIDTGAEFYDLLPYAPLFAPQIMPQMLAVRWSDGRNYLLTWPGADTRPIDPLFLTRYERAWAKPSVIHDFPLTEMEKKKYGLPAR